MSSMLASNIRINGDRLWASLMGMAKIGATPAGGCNRQALTELDKQGRDLFVTWAQDAGCSVRVDELGNIFAVRPGADDKAATVLTGSHLDTQPTGGKFDGVYGVLAGLEVVRTLNDHNTQTPTFHYASRLDQRRRRTLSTCNDGLWRLGWRTRQTRDARG